MNKDNLDFLINENDIITVVGAGGKTSLINYIADTYRARTNVLVTTTTKIYVPTNELYDEIFMLNKYDTNALDINKDSGITVIGKYINKEEKIVGVDFEELDNLSNRFELVLIEGDGSKRKKLKGWNNTEPVVYKSSTKTIGVLDITSYGMCINEDNIHRLEEFKVLTDTINDKVNIDDLINVVLNKNGLFKSACGEKILFINKVEDKYYEEISEKLIAKLNKYNHDLKVVYGSIKNKQFTLI